MCLTSWLSFLPLQLLNCPLSPPMAWRRVARAQQKGKIALGDGFTPDLSELLDNRSKIFQVFQRKGKSLRAKSAGNKHHHSTGDQILLLGNPQTPSSVEAHEPPPSGQRSRATQQLHFWTNRWPAHCKTFLQLQIAQLLFSEVT